jgi:hypothetical protein
MEINFMAIENKRISQLTQMSSEEIQPNDLLLIIDTTAHESKNMTVLDFETYLHGIGNITTLSYTTSYVKGSNVDGYVNLSYNSNTSSFSNYSNISSQSYNSNTSSYALSASSVAFSVIPSSSYLIYSPNNGTASHSVNADTSSMSNVTNYLNFTGINNGTASHAITTDQVLNSIYSQTSSYLNSMGTIVSVASASHANISDYSLGGQSDTTNYLNYSPNNGTASYAISAGTVSNFIIPQGIFLSTTQSINLAQIDDIDVFWSTNNLASTPIEAIGTLDIPFTSSGFINGNIYLGLIDRNTGYQTTIDSSPISFNLSSTVGTWGNYDSGSLSIPFVLAGEPSLYGSYLLYVSASSNLQIDNNRKVRFNISTQSDTFDLGVYSNGPLVFSTQTSIFGSSVLFSFTSTDGGPFTDTAANINYTQSLGKQIFNITSIGTNIGNISYFWKVNGIISASFSNNSDLSYISGIPNTTKYFVCSNNALNQLYSFVSSSLMYLDCNTNSLINLSSLPTSMSYINCSNNNISNLSNLPTTLSFLNCSNNSLSSLPISLPYGLKTFLAGNNSLISSLPNPITDTVISMSVDNDVSLNTIGYLPLSLSYCSMNNCPIPSLPSLPPNILYLSMVSCSLNIAGGSGPIDNITTELLNNVVTNPTLINGTLNILGNGSLIYAPTSLTNINTLVNTYGWTVYHD